MNRSFVVVGCLGLLAVGALRAEEKARPDLSKLPPAAARTIDFPRDIQPILARSCLTCHGPEKQKGGLRLDDADAALKGGNSGPVIKPGDAAQSRLLHL